MRIVGVVLYFHLYRRSISAKNLSSGTHNNVVLLLRREITVRIAFVDPHAIPFLIGRVCPTPSFALTIRLPLAPFGRNLRRGQSLAVPLLVEGDFSTPFWGFSADASFFRSFGS